MTLYVVTDQDVDFVSKPLSELLMSKGVDIKTSYFGPNDLDFWLTDNLFLVFLQKHCSCINGINCHFRGAYFRYNTHDKSQSKLYMNFLVPTSDCGGADDENEGGSYFIEFTYGERIMLKKLCFKMWLKVFSIHLRAFYRKILDGLRLKNG